MQRLWQRELDHYPAARVRISSLAIVVLATIVLYYQFYLSGAVATHIITEYHMSFVYFVNISVVGYVLGALASFLAGLSDRYGRANIVTIGLFVTGLLCLVGIPNAHSKLAFGILFVAIGFVEGIILVATPALIRDFSPQLGRASAMGFWTLGPVIGSLVVSIAVSNTSDRTAWQDQYIACGVVGLVIAAIALLGLRELAPSLRDQLMVSSRDRALIEARAKGVDVEAGLRHPFRQMLKVDIIGSAFAISVFLIIYYVAVGFFPIYFQTIFGFSQSKANALGNWNWAFNALGLLVIGVISDLVRVRKPFMIVGAIGVDRLHDPVPEPGHAPAHQLLDVRVAARRAQPLAGRRLRALDGQLHRDGRAPEPGADRHRPGRLGPDHPRGHRGVGVLRAARRQHRHHPGRQGLDGAGHRRRAGPAL